MLGCQQNRWWGFPERFSRLVWGDPSIFQTETVLVRPVLAIAIGLACTASAVLAQDRSTTDQARLELPRVVLEGVPFEGWVVAEGTAPGDSLSFTVTIAGAAQPISRGTVAGGDSIKVAGLALERPGIGVTLETPAGSATAQTRVLPGWLSVLPSLIAITFALLFRQVVISLLAGVWLGALFIYNWNPLTAIVRTIDKYIVEAITDPNNAQILIFTFLLGGMVGIISRNGGTHGVVDSITRHAVGPIRGQLAAYVMGLLIFFDDYSNTLIVGSTMRPVTDGLNISREKLAYIVDSTAAPVASIALIGGWIGFEVGLIDSALEPLNLGIEPYVLFVQSIPYRFYPILALAFVLMVIVTNRDYGPMLAAELRAHREGEVLREGANPASDFDAEILNPIEGRPRRWWNALVPIGTVAAITLIGMYTTGREAVLAAGDPDLGLQNVVANGNSFSSLIWGSFAACVVAAVMTLSQRILNLEETMAAWVAGLKAMLFACIVLTLAWSIGAITVEIHTAGYVVSLLTGNLDPRLLPVLVFVMCAFVSFATGTSWGTMAIMMPVVVPLRHHHSVEHGNQLGPHRPRANSDSVCVGGWRRRHAGGRHPHGLRPLSLDLDRSWSRSAAGPTLRGWAADRRRLRHLTERPDLLQALTYSDRLVSQIPSRIRVVEVGVLDDPCDDVPCKRRFLHYQCHTPG
jgi:Na+/H+ antiporter NhaC